MSRREPVTLSIKVILLGNSIFEAPNHNALSVCDSFQMKKQEHQLKERVLGTALIYIKANFHLVLRHPLSMITEQEDIHRIYRVSQKKVSDKIFPRRLPNGRGLRTNFHLNCAESQKAKTFRIARFLSQKLSG